MAIIPYGISASLAKIASGAIDMFITSAPHDWNILLSAIVENLEPSIVITVPLQ